GRTAGLASPKLRRMLKEAGGPPTPLRGYLLSVTCRTTVLCRYLRPLRARVIVVSESPWAHLPLRAAPAEPSRGCDRSAADPLRPSPCPRPSAWRPNRLGARRPSSDRTNVSRRCPGRPPDQSPGSPTASQVRQWAPVRDDRLRRWVPPLRDRPSRPEAAFLWAPRTGRSP